MSDLAQVLSEMLQAEGWSVQRQGDSLSADKRVILSRWLLGSRRLDHRLRLKFDQAGRVLGMQESAKEAVVGLPPPSFSVMRTRQTGLDFNESRSDRGWGGGDLRYGEMRDRLARICEQRGWKLELRILL